MPRHALQQLVVSLRKPISCFVSKTPKDPAMRGIAQKTCISTGVDETMTGLLNPSHQPCAISLHFSKPSTPWIRADFHKFCTFWTRSDGCLQIVGWTLREVAVGCLRHVRVP